MRYYTPASNTAWLPDRALYLVDRRRFIDRSAWERCGSGWTEGTEQTTLCARSWHVLFDRAVLEPWIERFGDDGIVHTGVGERPMFLVVPDGIRADPPADAPALWFCTQATVSNRTHVNRYSLRDDLTAPVVRDWNGSGWVNGPLYAETVFDWLADLGVGGIQFRLVWDPTRATPQVGSDWTQTHVWAEELVTLEDVRPRRSRSVPVPVVTIAEPQAPRPWEPTGAANDSERGPSRSDVATALSSTAGISAPDAVASLRPAVRFCVQPADQGALPVGSCRFGGDPDLPADVPWPTTTIGDLHKPLRFFAQIDLAEARRAAPGELGLPAAGLLLCFAHCYADDPDDLLTAQDETHWLNTPWPPAAAVLHIPPGRTLERRPSPVPALPVAAWRPVGLWSVAEPTFEGDIDAHELFVRWQTAAIEHTVGPDWDATALHQLAGHAQTKQSLQDDPDDDDGEGARVVVLQVDADEILEVEWGGRLYWTAPEGDLRLPDLQGVRFNLDHG